MTKFTIRVSQNGWEYTGYVYIKADKITIKNSNIAVVTRGNDTFEIEFDEEIRMSN